MSGISHLSNNLVSLNLVLQWWGGWWYQNFLEGGVAVFGAVMAPSPEPVAVGAVLAAPVFVGALVAVLTVLSLPGILGHNPQSGRATRIMVRIHLRP